MSVPEWVIENYREAMGHVHQAASLVEDAEISSPDVVLRAGRRRAIGALNEVYGDLSRLLGTLRDLAASDGDGRR